MRTPSSGPYPPSWPPHEPATLGDWIWSAVSNAWEWVGAQQGPVVALAAVVTAIIAIFALHSTAKDSRERTRPIVLAYFRLSPNNESAFDLVLHNYGTSAASEVEVTFDPEFTDEQRKDGMVESLAKRYEKPIPVMPPGAEITNVWWSLDFSPHADQGSNRHPIPDEATMTITYKGNRILRHKEKVNLDTNWMKGHNSTVSSGSRPGLERQKTEALKKIADEVRASRFLLRDIAAVMEGENGSEPEEYPTLSAFIAEAGSDKAALAARFGVSEEKATLIAELVEAQPKTGDIDVISNGQITPRGAGPTQ